MNTGNGVILVTGATGQQGGAVARELLAAGHTVKAMTRKPESERAKALAGLGAEVVQGDLDDAGSVERAVQGAWGVFAVQNTWEAGVEVEEAQGKRIAEIAKQAGVHHFVYTSVGSAHRQTGIPHFDNKFRVEESVRALGFPSYAILRPVFFMENLLSPWFKPGIDDGKLMIGVKPDTVLQMIAVPDIGKYGLLAFERHEELNGRAIDIAGDQHTMPQAAAIIGQAAGRSVTFVPVPIEEVRKFSEDFAIMLEWFDRVGYDVDIATNAEVYGVRPTSLADWAANASWA
ncbi:MAG: NmrA family NAD(P)-binding protein [Gemmatimonadales bacterium]|nr:NmrA family NAD(P)-binding protein [Gemmatimonadales bacterium]NIN12299.1 NmrA family NAD(P)-binding protein [Gemmatimonadales bacterium]NIN48837.1 NmrA family NAD(P)-binding protein [Gemmatimonadales bacterium]NIP06301.1 NmrA family NAD(P)-binding protein [Gemmatimonadales bacterium]NIR00673.1 NmrA family NAD(P)-binding protein [Gemmatimonadales bacterium]